MSAYLGNVSQTMKALRKAGDMTQRDLAKALGITAAFLNDIEHGRRNLTDARILACKVAGIRAALVGARCYEYRAKIAYLKAEAAQ